MNERGLSKALAVKRVDRPVDAMTTNQRCSLQCPTRRHVEKAAMVEEEKWILAVDDGLASAGW
jgi:hypothetical protein